MSNSNCEHWQCGNPAKFSVALAGGSTMLLCGVHVRKYQKQPWRKVTPLKPAVTLGSASGRIVSKKPNFKLVERDNKEE